MKPKLSPWFAAAIVSLCAIILWRFFGVNTDGVMWENQIPGALQQSITPHLIIVIIGYVGLYALIWTAVWWKVGREYIEIPVGGSAATALPPVRRSPGLVAYLVNQGELGESAYAATILYLAKKKMLRLVTENGVTTIYFQPQQCTEDIEFADRLVFSNLLHQSPNGESVTYDEIKALMALQPEQTKRFYRAWKEAISKQANELGFFETNGMRTRTIFYAVSIFYAIPLVSLLDMGKVIGEHNGIPVDIFLIAYANAIYWLGRGFMRWSRVHAEEVSRWIAFKRYISGVTRLHQEGPESMPVWDDILIYATALGCAKKVNEALPLNIKAGLNNPSLDGLLVGRYA